MFAQIKDILFGPALPTHTKEDRTLNKIRALAAFSPDALASIAYANQEIYLGLVVAGSVGLSYAWPIGLAIAGLLAIVALSSRRSWPATVTCRGSSGAWGTGWLFRTGSLC
jgi:hypothetical protein